MAELHFAKHGVVVGHSHEVERHGELTADVAAGVQNGVAATVAVGNRRIVQHRVAENVGIE